jgi:hypothetical protein
MIILSTQRRVPRQHCRTAMQMDHPTKDTSPPESPAELKVLELFQ